MLYYLFTDQGELEIETQQQHSGQKLERKSLEELEDDYHFNEDRTETIQEEQIQNKCRGKYVSKLCLFLPCQELP